MEENTRFRSDFSYDLAAYKEFNNLLTLGMGRNAFMNCLTVLSMLFLLTQLDNTLTRVLTMILSGYFLLYRLFRHIRNRDGGIGYRQILHSNEGNIPHQIVTFGEDGIRSRNPNTGKEILDSYDSLRYLMESENLLIMVTELRMCHILDKRSIEGGAREDVIRYLRENCPRLKKRIKTGRLGQILNIALVAVAALALVFGSFITVRNLSRQAGRLSNRLTYTEIAAELESVGIAISPEAIADIEAFDAQYAQDQGDFYANNPEAVKVQDLLYWEGCGIWDGETWEWTPSESGIYWFDMEVMNLESIYTDFLRGVDALSDDLRFTDVSEDYSAVDLEGGYGTVFVSFQYGGTHHELKAVYDYDWFDTEMIRSLGRILSADDKAENLWFAGDGGQGVYLYYGTEVQMKLLEKLSGLDFMDCELNGILG